MLHEGTEYVFTDGAASANGYLNCRAAWGVFFNDGDPRNCSDSIRDGPVSNQVAELTAISEALQLISNDLMPHPIVIVTDSKYAVDCLTKWYKQWEKNNWQTQKGEAVKHQQLIKKCVSSLSKNVKNISFLHVNSHRKMPTTGRGLPWVLWYGNDKADKLAGSALPRGRSTGMSISRNPHLKVSSMIQTKAKAAGDQ